MNLSGFQPKASGRTWPEHDVLATGLLAGKTVQSIATGSDHNLAVCSDGTVAVWGADVRQVCNPRRGRGVVPVPEGRRLSKFPATVRRPEARYPFSAAIVPEPSACRRLGGYAS